VQSVASALAQAGLDPAFLELEPDRVLRHA